MTPPVSVVVVSRQRPDALCLCLTGLSQLDWPSLEVVVVACSAGVAAAQAHKAGRHAKITEYNAANISAARNRGIAAAAGEIVAFIDDDAVPEPSWLRHLIAPFSESEVSASGGYVIGRNGISLQWAARTIDQTGQASGLRLASDDPVVLTGRPDRAIKTEGTNMALRREVLAGMGGFDPAFRFYLDETDLNMRLARSGQVTALVPLARVHHGFAPSERRRRDRTPRDLSDIGASSSVFLRKHAPDAQHDIALDRLRAEQRSRLIGLLERGPLDPLDVIRLMRSLERGISEGRARALDTLPSLPRARDGFCEYPSMPDAPHRLISGLRRGPLRDRALAALAEGALATVFRFTPTALYHQMIYHPDGYWEQRGGLFGKSERSDPLIRLTTRRARVARERIRLRPVRPFDDA